VRLNKGMSIKSDDKLLAEAWSSIASEGNDHRLFYSTFEKLVDSLSDEELNAAVEMLRKKPLEITRMIREEHGYRNAMSKMDGMISKAP